LRGHAALAGTFDDALHIHGAVGMMIRKIDFFKNRYPKILKGFDEGFGVSNRAQ
jgi:hypothetical protein